MSRMDRYSTVFLVVAVTLLTTEWIHYRLGEGLFARIFGEPSATRGLVSLSDHDPSSVTESEFQAYLRILEAMQADHDLPIEQALEAEQLTLERFRDVEQRVQRNDVLVERARTTLKEKAQSLWNERGKPLEHG
jgi:hypothetical protein